MSRVGKAKITVPSNVQVEYANGTITIKGPNGTLSQEIKSPVTVEYAQGSDSMHLARGNEESQSRALHGLYNRLIQNMIRGVTTGFAKHLIINGVGYKAAQKGEGLVLNLGMSHPCEIKPEDGIKFKVLTPAEVQTLNLGKDGIGAVIQVTGASKEKVGAVASKIRDLRPVEPYHMYGIRYSDEHVIRKESKSGAKGKKK